LLVAVLKDVKSHFDLSQIENGLVPEVDPLDDVLEILHGLTVEFEEAQSVEQSVQVLKERRQFVFEGLLIEEDEGFGNWVVQEV
jgi:hypothetical protein